MKRQALSKIVAERMADHYGSPLSDWRQCAVQEDERNFIFDKDSECYQKLFGVPQAQAVLHHQLTGEATPPVSRGLGDTIKKVTDATGVSYLAKLFERVTGLPCGCPERRKRLNERFPYDAR